MRSVRQLLPITVLNIALFILSGCTTAESVATASATPPLAPIGISEEDTTALAQLAYVAPRTSTIEVNLADWTECWLPSEHLLPEDEVGNATTWKVICRIYWHETDGTPRYQDTNCIGDFANDPMLDHCYRWVHYDFETAYGDHASVFAGLPGT